MGAAEGGKQVKHLPSLQKRKLANNIFKKNRKEFYRMRQLPGMQKHLLLAAKFSHKKGRQNLRALRFPDAPFSAKRKKALDFLFQSAMRNQQEEA